MASAFFGTLYLFLGVCVLLWHHRADCSPRESCRELRPGQFLLFVVMWPGVLLAEFVGVLHDLWLQ